MKPKPEKEKQPNAKSITYNERNHTAYIKLVEHLDGNHLAYVSQYLPEENLFCGYLVRHIIKKKDASNNYLGKDLGLEKCLDYMKYHGSASDFITKACAASHKFVLTIMSRPQLFFTGYSPILSFSGLSSALAALVTLWA
jgi:hypothetical protein